MGVLSISDILLYVICVSSSYYKIHNLLYTWIRFQAEITTQFCGCCIITHSIEHKDKSSSRFHERSRDLNGAAFLRGAFRRLTPAVLHTPCVLGRVVQSDSQALKKNEDAAFSA